MKTRSLVQLVVVALVVSIAGAFAAAPAAASSGVTRKIAFAGTGSPATGAFVPSNAWLAWPEFPGVRSEATPAAYQGIIARSLSRSRGEGEGSSRQPGQNPGTAQINASFDGLNLFQQRFARGGNQFTVEPPDQALCVGSGFVVEAVNDVFNVYNASGVSQLPANNVGGAVDLNSFYGYPPAIDRTTGARGPFVTDPTCYYDPQTRRFYLVALTLEVAPSGAFTLENHLDIAVSNTSDPTGTWRIYRLDVTNDGSSNPDPLNACPCLGDYPHVGADAYGFYVTTNSYPWLGDGFNGAQIYAFSKRQLASGAASVDVTHIDTFGAVGVPSAETARQPGFTVWPAQSPGTASYALGAGGTEYFLSSNAADEATHPVSGLPGTRTSTQLVVWALKNTSSLDRTTRSLTLSNTVLSVNRYAMPPMANQPGSGTPPGRDVPQGHCINDTTTRLEDGETTGCWRLLFAREPAHDEVVSRLDSNDTRMQQVMYAKGKVWGALDTAVSFDTNPTHNKAGIAWYIITPTLSSSGVAATVALQGTFGEKDVNLIYPAIGVTEAGRGVVAMTLVGAKNNPSAAFAPIDVDDGIGDVQIIAAGAAPNDGFTGYKAQVGFPPRTRWGDYGAAAVDGDSIWIASEYIARACSYTTWGASAFENGTGPLGICDGTRAALGNWATRITKLTP
jgi:hypothetical protein